ncbi:MAG: hypothetical protein JXA54_11330 [Candidatus Heimdallarchaeota archaeon]|nr:hypothetical protein [Candidatus Heimdallarchaeota archaeon]
MTENNIIEALIKKYVYEYLEDLKKVILKYLEPLCEYLKPKEGEGEK